jgi:hypothetical protein
VRDCVYTRFLVLMIETAQLYNDDLFIVNQYFS